ncbi:hypothetical protein KIN20_011589 [Parelaphostrongylus tenuis]|uniref:Uncharacterized protein n=1 Tax=Parelaphostrongylus tenuis TaxID=148309 RepID=A0AAD5N0E2_PARTN|nr:hypothetical protein KIN20_011589 [Parelaphostrongylus tenuis]
MVKHSQATRYNAKSRSPSRARFSLVDFSGMSVSRSSFVTPCAPNKRRRYNSVNLDDYDVHDVHTIAPCDGSPLMDVINSPKIRELRRERELRSLRKQNKEIEDLLVNSESQVSELRNKTESLTREIVRKNEYIRSMEAKEKLSLIYQEELEANAVMFTKQLEDYKRQCNNQEERLATYKIIVDELEEKQVDLREQLDAKNSSLAALERQLRDLKDEAEGTLQQLKIIDTERNTLTRLLEEERRTAASEREQHQRAISDWQKRFDMETTNAMSLYTNENARNAVHQQEIREKIEQLEKIRILYDSDKRSHEKAVEEIKKRSQEKCDALMKRLAEATARLSHEEERYKSFVIEHEAIVEQLESVHMAEIVQRDSKISIVCARIRELETIVTERERTIEGQRKNLALIRTEKEAIESAFANMQTDFKKSEDQLNDATMMIEKLNGDVESVARKFNDTNRSVEILQAECSELQSLNRKDAEVHELVKALKALLKAYNETVDELQRTKQCLDEQRQLPEFQESEARSVIEDLKKRLVVLEGKNRLHADALSLLEVKFVSRNDFGEFNEELLNRICEQLREKHAVRGEDLLSLLMKFERLETDFFLASERTSELESELMRLREENALAWKYMEISTSNEFSYLPSIEELIKSILETDTALDFHLHTSLRELLRNEDELPFYAIRDSHRELSKMEDKSAINCKPSSAFDCLQLSHQPNSSNADSRCNSATSAPSTVYSKTSVPKTNSSYFSLNESYASVDRDVENFDRDQSKLSELQRRHTLLYPTIRCAHVTEVEACTLPLGSKNVVKQGHQSAKRRNKLFQRASSYVKRKLPLSDSTNSQRKHF